jgi:hypothetical protein
MSLETSRNSTNSKKNFKSKPKSKSKSKRRKKSKRKKQNFKKKELKQLKKLMGKHRANYFTQNRLSNEKKYFYFQDYYLKLAHEMRASIKQGRFKYIKYKVYIQMKGFNNPQLFRYAFSQRWWWNVIDDPKHTNLNLQWFTDDEVDWDTQINWKKLNGFDVAHSCITANLMPEARHIPDILEGKKPASLGMFGQGGIGGGRRMGNKDRTLNDVLIRGI